MWDSSKKRIMKNIKTTLVLLFVSTIMMAQIPAHLMPFDQSNYPKVDNWNIAVFPIDFTDIPQVYRDSFPTKESWSDIIFKGAISDWYNTTSHGTTTITGDVYDYTTSSEVFFDGNGPLGFPQVLNSVDLSAPGFDNSNYDYIVFIICHDAAVAQSITAPKDFTINGTAYNQSVICTSYQNGSWWRDAVNYPNVNDQLMDSMEYVIPLPGNNGLERTSTYPMRKFESVLLHEIGHSMGLSNHANTRTNGNQPDYATEIPNNEDFLNLGYGNKFDIMGKREYGVTMNGGMSSYCGFIDSTAIYSKNWYGTTTVTVASLMSNTGKRYIEVLLPDQKDNLANKNHGYGLEIRTATAYSSMLSMPELSGNLDGFFVYKIAGTKNQLLDMSPSDNISYQSALWVDLRDVVLKPGMTYENDDVKFGNVLNNGDGTWSVDITIKATKILTHEPVFTSAERFNNGDIKVDWVNNCTDCETDQLFMFEYREVGTDYWNSIYDAVLTAETYTTNTFASDTKIYEFRALIGANTNHYSSIYSNTVSTVSSSIDKIQKSKFKLFPNPTTGVVKFEGGNINKIEILDLMGNSLLKDINTNTVDISSLGTGLYLIKITSNNYTSNFRIIKK